jgi:hypothetical protein
LNTEQNGDQFLQQLRVLDAEQQFEQGICLERVFEL